MRVKANRCHHHQPQINTAHERPGRKQRREGLAKAHVVGEDPALEVAALHGHHPIDAHLLVWVQPLGATRQEVHARGRRHQPRVEVGRGGGAERPRMAALLDGIEDVVEDRLCVEREGDGGIRRRASEREGTRPTV